MQQFRILTTKEILSCFRSSTAYFVFFVYLFVSLGSAFYFGSYLSMHDASLYSLFRLQPIILAVIVPALTMRIWPDEYKSGTAEFLLTQPVSYYVPVLAKYVSVALFCLGQTLFLLPFIFYTSSWLALDWGNILLSYVGVWFVICLFCALGCFVAALCRSVIIAYVVSVFLTSLYLSLPQLDFYAVYSNFLFAEIGLFDVLYFVSAISVLLVTNVLAIGFMRSGEKHKTLKFAGFVLGMAAVLFLFDFTAGNFFKTKGDFTAAKLYTLKSVSKEVIKQVNEPITVDIYVAKDYVASNADYARYLQQVGRFVERYENLSGGMISVNVTYVDAFSPLEEEIIGRGLYYEENGKGSKNYFGAFIRSNSGYEVVIKQFLLQRRPLLEKDFASAFLKLVNPTSVKTVGVYLDPMQNIGNYQGILLGLENDYNVKNIYGSEYIFFDSTDVLVLINPKKLKPYFIYALDQYIMRGGKVVVFFDLFTESQSEIINEKNVSFMDFLDEWRIKIKSEFVDEGKLADGFGKIFAPLVLNKAVAFEIDNKNLSITPFIYSGTDFVGAIVGGIFPSVFKGNLYKDTEWENEVPQYMSLSSPAAQVAIVGDVDMLEDSFWVSADSPDMNPYGVVEKSINGAAFKALVDYMAGNKTYLSLPYNDYLLNRESIAQKLQRQIFSPYETEYATLKNKIDDENMLLYEESGENLDKMNTLLQISQAGRSIAQDEKKLQNMEYEISSKYVSSVRKMALIQLLLLPLGFVLLLFLSVKIRDKKMCVWIKGKFNE